jgi:hypothetical protein
MTVTLFDEKLKKLPATKELDLPATKLDFQDALQQSRSASSEAIEAAPSLGRCCSPT